jgi:hypothetical protein
MGIWSFGVQCRSFNRPVASRAYASSANTVLRAAGFVASPPPDGCSATICFRGPELIAQAATARVSTVRAAIARVSIVQAAVAREAVARQVVAQETADDRSPLVLAFASCT